MKFSGVAISLASCWGIAQAKTPYFLLVGDSTVAVDGGWGDGFLSYLQDPGEGENRGSSGKTTVSWKSDGRWDALLATVEATKNDYEPIVTIQFGHNDQKVMDAAEFQGNMESIVNDLAAAGATPVNYADRCGMLVGPRLTVADCYHFPYSTHVFRWRGRSKPCRVCRSKHQRCRQHRCPVRRPQPCEHKLCQRHWRGERSVLQPGERRQDPSQHGGRDRLWKNDVGPFA